jgi:hypothetical protein
MVIPKNIGCNGIATHGFGHPDTVFPVFSRYSCGMHLPGDDLEGFSIQQEFLLIQFKRMYFFLGAGCAA